MGRDRPVKDFDFIVGGPALGSGLDRLGRAGCLASGPFGSPRWFPPLGSSTYADLIPIPRFATGLWPCENIVDVLNQFDCTINAVAIDVRTGTIYDPQNGRRDASRRVMRAVRFDYFICQPASSPVGLDYAVIHWHRFVHYASVLHLEIEPLTLRWLRANRPSDAESRRFAEVHSLGVLEIATRIFDTVTDPAHVSPETRAMLPELSDRERLRYWRQVLRVAALCHDVGHLPFSHAAEADLLPPGWKHEHLTRAVILDDELGRDIDALGLRRVDVAKVAVGQKAWPAATFSPWEKIVSQIIVADAFGADRIDYLMRDPRHVGVRCPRFDPKALIAAMRILPAARPRGDASHRRTEGPDPSGRHAPREPALGMLLAGLAQAESLLRARHFMFTRVFYHHARCAYDIHLSDFLRSRLPRGQYPVAVARHVVTDDLEVAAACGEAARDPRAAGHDAACRLVQREPFRLFYCASSEATGEDDRHGGAAYRATARQFGAANVRRDSRTLQSGSLDFPVQLPGGPVVPSTAVSHRLARQAGSRMERLYIHPQLKSKARRWLAALGGARTVGRAIRRGP